MSIERKPTGLYAWNGEIYVGDSIHYDDGWMIQVFKIEEVNGKVGYYFRDDIGIYMKDNEFMVLTEWPQYFEDNTTNEDFEILHPDHPYWYGIHAPLYGEAIQATYEFDKRWAKEKKKQYYCLRLWDYSAPSFVSRSKPYYGTMDDIRSLMNALEADEKHRADHAETIAAFREYEAGNHAVTHNVAYHEYPILEPVDLIGEAILRQENLRWQHLNTWNCPYHMVCSYVETHHLWLSSPKGCLRALKARFRDLCYRSSDGDVMSLEGGFWGHPEMLCVNENALCNRLAVTEKRFETEEEARKDMAAFRKKKDADFTEFCEDIFGDG